jgi:3-methyl-2-oxobutanoate hydroxymethyltransferase
MSTLPAVPDGTITIRQRTTIHTVQAKRDRGEPITMLTAYDYPSARAVDEAGVDMILVGDSLAMVVLGHENTLAVTMEEMLHHARAVRRGARSALLIGDMPFMSYQADIPEAVRNAGRFLQEGGMDAVKLEGGRAHVDTIRAILRAGIPVQGHIGLTPQSVNLLGGWKVQGRTPEAALRLVEDALALEEAGCFSLVLESVPDRLASAITQRLRIPTIGIGAGVGTSGQVLVYHDVLGLYDRFTPKFVRRYGELGREIALALAAYCEDVAAGRFPDGEHSYGISDEAWGAIEQRIGGADTRSERVGQIGLGKQGKQGTQSERVGEVVGER